MSCQNNIGSCIGIDYDYASHHVNPSRPIGGSDGAMYSSLAVFSAESQVDKEMSLGYGTNSNSESQKKHKAAMEKLLSVIDVDQKLEQEPALEGTGESGNAST